MKLGIYINQLLAENETVIVPGFGAFISSYKPAQIDEESGQIRPPSKEISFTPKIRNNDGLLVGFVAEQEGISHFEALHKIETEREEIVYRLDKGEKVTLENTGIFSVNESNEIQLESFAEENLSLDSFGLEATSMEDNQVPENADEEQKELSQDTEKSEVTEEKEEQPLANQETEAKEPKPEQTVGDVEKKEPHFEPVAESRSWRRQEKPQEKKRRWLWFLLILIPLAVAGVFILSNQKENKQDTIEVITETPPEQNNQTGEPEMLAVDSTQTDTAATDSVTEITPGQKTDTFQQAAREKTKYYLIGGSFKEQENADKYFKQLKDEGYEPFHLGKKGNFYMVGIGKYDSEEDALVAQYYFLEKNPDSGAWIYEE